MALDKRKPRRLAWLRRLLALPKWKFARMKAPKDLSLPEDRSITEREAAVVDWLLAHGAFEGNLDHLRATVRELRVVARCGCGCASVDFAEGGQAGAARPVADAIGCDSRGRKCGVIVWELDGRVSGLEIYELDGGSSLEVPAVESLLPDTSRWYGSA